MARINIRFLNFNGEWTDAAFREAPCTSWMSLAGGQWVSMQKVTPDTLPQSTAGTTVQL